MGAIKCQSYIILMLASLFVFVSCEKDNNEFDVCAQSCGTLTQRGSLYDMTYDNSSRMVSCRYSYTFEKADFEYGLRKIAMKYDGAVVGKSGMAYLGGNGYIDRLEIKKIQFGDPFCASFEYDKKGYVVGVKFRNDNETTDCVITYNSENDITAIDVVKNKFLSHSGTTVTDIRKYVMEYTDDMQLAPIENRSGLNFIDDFIYWGEYMKLKQSGSVYSVYWSMSVEFFTEWVALYHAGLLGKGTAHLPIRISESGTNDYMEYEWTLDDNGMPESVKETCRYISCGGRVINPILWM